MKVGKIVLAGREDFLFWRLSHFLMLEGDYRIIRLNKDHSEMWLENAKNKQARMIRLVKAELDWANRVKRDQETVVNQGEKLRKHLFARQLNIINIYITSYPPVDLAQHTFEKEMTIGQGKTNLKTLFLTRQNENECMKDLGDLLEKQLQFAVKEEYEDAEVYVLSQGVLAKAAHQEKAERQIFEFSKPLFTYVLMAIQVLIFILLEINGGSTNSETLIKFGAKYNPLIMEGEWWRLITPVFLHIGFFHLAMNTLSLYYLGTAVEKMFGHTRFLWIYLVSGLTGTLASFVFSMNLAAGASGAIFGCFGALLYMGFRYPQLFFRTMGLNVIVLIVINLIFGFTVPGIDNAGHIGGLVGGFLATGIVHFPKKRNGKIQSLFSVAMIIAIAVMLYSGLTIERPDVINAQAQERLDNGENEKAYQLLADYVSEGKGNAVTFFQLSYLEIQMEQYEPAKQHLLEAIQLNPDFHEAYFNLALLFFEEGDIVKAREYAEKAESLSKEDKYQDLLDKLTE